MQANQEANDGDSDSEDISDSHELNQTKTEALRDIDKGGFSRFHLKMCFVAGTGFFTDAYDIFVINLVSVVLGYVYGYTPGPGPGLAHQLSSTQDFRINVAAPVGYLFGRLLFGWLADSDIVGSKRMYGIEQMIIVISTFAQVIAGSGPRVNIIGVLVVCRFIMGVGVSVGGYHPLNTLIASKSASTNNRGRLLTTVFTAQSWRNFAVFFVALVTAHTYKDAIIAYNFNEHVDFYWRILIGLGCVPSTIALYFRLTILETPRFTMDIDRDIQRAKADVENMLGPEAASASAVHWVGSDAVVHRAKSPRRS